MSQASFNNTIVAVTDVRGRVVSVLRWYFWIQRYEKRTPFAAQTAAANAIRTLVVDHGMQRAEVMIKGSGLRKEMRHYELSVEVGPGYVTAQDIILPP
ncbi:30S ribosomal protein S11, chloroplastic [Datura stramonium]|uniref:30S ribosomal protein S11, chloroplastic n=1 Tax=Datura stramonium TaxID=4076 RepID=A0ABS8SR96_DATST|nr:30S ribosomal protein S11, chloroplastic [Datura stramonium]